MFLVMKLVFACPKNRTIDSNQEQKLQGTKRNGCALYAFSNPPLPQSELATCKSTLDLKPAITTSLVSFLSVWVKGRCAFLSHWYLLNCLCYNNSLLENRRLAVGINGRRRTVAVVRRRFLSFCWTRHHFNVIVSCVFPLCTLIASSCSIQLQCSLVHNVIRNTSLIPCVMYDNSIGVLQFKILTGFIGASLSRQWASPPRSGLRMGVCSHPGACLRWNRDMSLCGHRFWA